LARAAMNAKHTDIVGEAAYSLPSPVLWPSRIPKKLSTYGLKQIRMQYDGPMLESPRWGKPWELTVRYMFEHCDEFQIGEHHSRDA